MQDDTKQTQEAMAKRKAKDSVFLDLFRKKNYLLKLYKTLHPEDTTATEDSLTNITITNNTSSSVKFLMNRQNSME